jgi:hypothetical protein
MVGAGLLFLVVEIDWGKKRVVFQGVGCMGLVCAKLYRGYKIFRSEIPHILRSSTLCLFIYFFVSKIKPQKALAFRP